MSDYCQQCSIEIFGEDNRDLANLAVYGVSIVLCEGCGIIKVNADGKCVDDGCPVHSKQTEDGK